MAERDTDAEHSIDPLNLRIDAWGEPQNGGHISGVKVTHSSGAVVAVDGLGQQRNRDAAIAAIRAALQTDTDTGC